MEIESLEKGLFLLRRERALATILVNRPEVSNSLTSQMWHDLPQLMRWLGEDDEVRVVIIRGVGERAFVAGADIRELQEINQDRERARQYLLNVEGCMASIEEIEKPVIAMVNGACVGGGCQLATACDLRYAAEHARFGIPAARLGIAITLHNSQRLARLVGLAWAKEMLMTGRTLEAQEALRIGLVNAVLPGDKLENFVYGLAREISQNAPLTLKAAKKYCREAFLHPQPSLEEGLRLSQEALASQDLGEGTRAFLEKRPPQFKGH